MKNAVTILVAEDSDDHFLLIEGAMKEAGYEQKIVRARDGEELMSYLFQNKSPDLLLLDLRLPKKDGLQALREIKADRVLKRIPVVVLSTSGAEEDIRLSYEYGASSYIKKPVEFEQFVEIMKMLKFYWFELVRLPDLKK